MTTYVRRGKWVADVRFRHADGTTQRVLKVSPIQTEKGAKRYAGQVLHALATGEYRKKGAKNPLLKDFVDGFLERFAINNKKSSATSERHMLMGHVVPLLGHFHLRDVGYAEVEKLKAAMLKKELQPKTVNNVVAALTGLLREAKKMRHIRELPEVTWLKVQKPKVDFITEEQFERLWQAAEPDWQPMLRLAVNTGLRLGELCALEWEDIDGVLHQAQIRSNVVRQMVGTPKGDSDEGKERVVPLNGPAQTALKLQRAMGVRGPLVFPNPKGKYWSAYNAPTLAIARAARVAKLGRKVTWKTLRSTFASWLIQRGASVKEVQELLGHGSLETTMRYLALAPSHRRRAVELLDSEALKGETHG